MLRSNRFRRQKEKSKKEQNQKLWFFRSGLKQKIKIQVKKKKSLFFDTTGYSISINVSALRASVKKKKRLNMTP
jgi:hypothetical protein